jgi:hypothetical protein
MAQKAQSVGPAGGVLAVLAWSMILVLVVWAERILGPASFPMKRLLVRAGAVVLVVPMLFLHPAALIVAWLLACVGVVSSIAGWARTGATPLPLWSVVVAGIFAIGGPVLLRRLPGVRRKEEEAASPAAPATPPAAEAMPATVVSAADVDPDRRVRYGTDLATRVADYLMSGGAIAEAHREYCGTGLCYHDGRFIYDEVEDATFRSIGSSSDEPLATFADRNAFIAWLAEQSDETLSGRERGNPWYLDNQRITRRRLEQELSDWARRRQN